MLRFRENTYVPTELHILSADRTQQALLDGRAGDDLFDLLGVGAVLRSAKDVLAHPAPNGFFPSAKVPELLTRWFLGLSGCVHAFDGIQADTETQKVLAVPSEYEELRQWVWKARRARKHLASSPPFPKELESITQSMSAARWRQELATLRSPDFDVKRIVSEWKDALVPTRDMLTRDKVVND